MSARSYMHCRTVILPDDFVIPEELRLWAITSQHARRLANYPGEITAAHWRAWLVAKHYEKEHSL